VSSCPRCPPGEAANLRRPQTGSFIAGTQFICNLPIGPFPMELSVDEVIATRGLRPPRKRRDENQARCNAKASFAR
jgi:hypothetical protein